MTGTDFWRGVGAVIILGVAIACGCSCSQRDARIDDIRKSLASVTDAGSEAQAFGHVREIMGAGSNDITLRLFGTDDRAVPWAAWEERVQQGEKAFRLVFVVPRRDGKGSVETAHALRDPANLPILLLE